METTPRSEGDPPVAVVLSGGGCLTFWSLGALTRIQPVLPPVREWAGVSAGSAMAAAVCAGKAQETMELFCQRTAANRSNVYPLNLLRGRPVFPHEEIYRSTILDAMGEDGFLALKASAPLRILLAHFTGEVSPIRTVMGAARAYRRRKKRWILHGPDTPHRGFGIQVVTAQELGTRERLCDVILASSCTPPITRVQTIDGTSFADGALVDHAPVRALSPAARAGRILVFSTMCIPPDSLPSIPGRLYLVPSRPIPISIWDYASPDRVRQAYELGLQDAERYLGGIDRFLDESIRA